MDKYVRHVKRRNDEQPGAGERPSSAAKRAGVREFYLPGDGAGTMPYVDATAGFPTVPRAPQKTRPPDSATTTPTATEMTERPKRQFVARRLFFDDDDITDKNVKQRRNSTDDVNDSMDKMQIISHDNERQSVVSFTTPATTTLNESQLMGILEKKTTRTPVESLSDRGFVVINGPVHSSVADEEDDHCWPTATSGHGKTPAASDCGGGGGCDLYECLSVFEGVVYGVLVAAADDGSAAMAAAGALSAVGPHPHVVAYHSCWTDGRFHYAQTEFCPDDLRSAARRRPATAADCRAVLEHVACALHYMHDCKGYAHNRVNSRNIHPVSDGDGGVAYKLGGFHGAARLPDARDAAAGRAFADVRALCSAVSLLAAARADSGDEDARSLRSHLSCVARQIDSARATGAWTSAAAAGANALGVWRWCCDVRLRQRPSPSLRDDEMDAGTGGANDDGGGGGGGTGL